MKWLEVAQGTEPWINARLGIPTASKFDAIISPKKLQPSTQQRGYLCALVAERVLQHPVVDFGSLWTDRGSALEREAVAYYELTTGRDTKACGFALTDDGRVGCSPDRLVGTDGLLEIKCPAAHTHLSYLFYGLGDEYRLQMQGQLYVTERHFVDFLSHCPGLPPVTYTVERDADVQKALGDALPDFCAEVDRCEKMLHEMMAGKQEVA